MNYICLRTSRREELIDISTEIQRRIATADFKDGLAVVYCPHTTAGLTVNEGADPAVKADIVDGLSFMVPRDRIYGHAEGNSLAHIKASLMGPSLTLLVEEGKLVLGQWQRVFFCEFDGPRSRTLYLKLIPS